MKLSIWAGMGMLLAASIANAQPIETSFDISVGYRNDALQWNIASDSSGSATPNILSELTWEDLQIAQLALGWQLTTANQVHLRLAGAYGWIYDGRNQDSDYLGNNRTLEFSRSNNETSGDNVWDLSAAIGYRFHYNNGASSVTPLLGASLHAQNLRITNGNQTIPALGPFSDLNSTYQTEWTSGWLGVELENKDTDLFRSFLRLEYHRADYYAEANWNLRTDFAHPKSFEHIADGDGLVVSFGGYSVPGRRRWSIRYSVDYQKWKTDPGTDRVFFASGATSTTRLNEVEWKSWSVSAGAQYNF